MSPLPGPSWAVPPRRWGARVDYDKWTDTYTPDDGIALHHGGSGDYSAGRPPFSQDKEMAQLRAWEDYHLRKGWRGLAYGWGIGQTGTAYRIRQWNTYGAHTGDVDGDGIANNDEILPFILILSGNHHDPSPAMQATIVRLRSYVEGEAPAATYLYGHQEVQGTPTTCPGPKVMAYIEGHRRLKERTDMPLLPLRYGDANQDVRLAKFMLNRVYDLDLEGNEYDDVFGAAKAEHLGGDPNRLGASHLEELLWKHSKKAAAKRGKRLFVQRNKPVRIVKGTTDAD